MFIMSPMWRPAPVAGICRHSSYLSYIICTKPGNLEESAKKANESGSRPETFRLSSRIFFSAGHRHHRYENVPHNNRLTFGVLYLNRFDRLHCCPVVQIQRYVAILRVPFVSPLVQGNNHRKKISAFLGKPLLKTGAVLANIYFFQHTVVNLTGQAVAQDIFGGTQFLLKVYETAIAIYGKQHNK
jgi:hypothetical protein